MLAVLPGEPGSLRCADLPELPAPAGSEVCVRMLRAPVNPADLLAIDGRYAFALDRATPLGAEGVGIVEAVGERVESLRPGDPVLPLTRGNWCRHRLLDQRDLVAVPPGIAIDQAAMLRINPLTAWLLLDGAGVRAGEIVVQNGAGSAVARWLRFFAVRRGAKMIDVVRRADPELPQALIDGPDLAERAKFAVGGRPIVAAFDCVAGEATGRLAQCLAPGGRITVFGHLSGAPVSVASQLLTGGGLSITGFSLRPAEAKLGPERVRRLFAEVLAFAGNAPELPIGAVVPLSEAESAVAAARRGGNGRVLLDLTA